MMEIEQETVYGTHEDSHVVMSEKVQSLAGSIYQEFEKMIGKYDEDVVKDLMPLVVNVLECLDLSYTENQEHEVELELLREDNEQLVTQYEREKQLRKTSEQKLLELEDAGEDERKELHEKIESLESIVRMLELKAKNSSDHVSRLEEKEQEQKREYTKLHERYTELFKTHMDYMERTKILMGSAERLEGAARGRLPAMNLGQLNRSSGPVSFGFTSLEAGLRSVTSPNEFVGPASPPDSNHSNTSLRNELQETHVGTDTSQMMDEQQNKSKETSEKGQLTDAISLEHRGTITTGGGWVDGLSPDTKDSTPELEDVEDITTTIVSPIGRSKTKKAEERQHLVPRIKFPGCGSSRRNGRGGRYNRNALNIVKDDLITRLAQRIQELEEELKKVREEAERSAKASKSDDEEDVPMAQRKRFTRVEMARVLMERNQYKERFMELQEAVRWTEMIRASRNDPTLDKKNKQSIWKLSSEKLAARRATERRDQYRQVRAHVKKDDGRLQAYGWSLPAKGSGPAGNIPQSQQSSNSNRQLTSSTTSQVPVPVPVPVYCRPLTETEPGMKIWCAAGVNLQGGRTRDGGSIVGASVFYTTTRSEGEEKGEGEMPEKNTCTEVEKLDKELREGEKVLREGQELETQLSSMVWICTSTHAASKVTVTDANNPAVLLESFSVCSSHLLCIASVPGARESDYVASEMDYVEPNNKDVTEQQEKERVLESADSLAETEVLQEEDGEPESDIGKISFVSCATGSNHPTTDTSTNRGEYFNDILYTVVEKMSSVLPTMWLGSQNGNIYVHSAVSQWQRCLHSVRLKDSVLSIVHIDGRVLAALADGSVAIFRRGPDGQWDLGSYHLVDLGRPHHSIRCMVAVHGKVWCGYRNKIHVLHPRSLKVEKSFDAHPRRESQVRQMAWLGDGVWVSIRLDSTLRLYHAHTYQHLQDVDIEPYVSKMLGTGKLGFSFVRITALLISSSRLWIGTGNGVIISVPLSESAGSRPASNNPQGAHRGIPGAVIRVYTDNSGDKLTPGSFIPYCSMAQAQLSFHGHRDAVKFFVAVPGTPLIENIDLEALDTNKPPVMLVMSGGEGYIDFRVGECSFSSSYLLSSGV
ncbi:hypothetical protein C0J52_16889 [Blattella germanica]|nr:hypothetical protein C0J52_16889 [Blattella germanica]